MRRVALPIVLAAAVAAGCGAEPDEGRQPGPLAVVARIACDQNGARVLTPEVKPQRDGLHLEMTNETAGEVHVTIERDREAAGEAAPPGRSEHVWPVGPGEWAATCYVAGGDGGEPPTFELSDPEGLWVSTELTDCELPESSHPDFGEGAAGERGEPVEIAARALAYDLAPGDVVERAGYPEQDPPVFRGRRGDRTIATISLSGDGSGGWLQGETTTYADPQPSGSSGVEGSG